MIIQWIGPWQFPASYSGLAAVAQVYEHEYGGKLYADWSGLYAGWQLLTGAWTFTAIVQTEAAPEPVVPGTGTQGGGGGFYHEYALYLGRAAKKRRRQKELEEESRALKDKVDREIAQLLRLQEAENDKRDNLARLQRLVQKYSKDALELSDRAKIAYVRALTQANFSALEALDRELQRMIEEEEIAALMILLNDE